MNKPGYEGKKVNNVRILVTGGAGFIGSHIVDLLCATGNDVTVLDNLSRGSLENINARAEFVQGDILDHEVSRLFADNRYDYVFHLAGQISVSRSLENPFDDARCNILGLLNILKCCRAYATRGIVFASSGGAIYGEQEGAPFEEHAAKQPISPYGVAKLCSEYYLNQFHRVTGIPYISLRLANAYGPRQSTIGEAGVVAIFLSRMLTNQPIAVYGDGTQTRDYVFVEDIARAAVSAMAFLERSPVFHSQSDIDSFAFNIGTGLATSVNTLFSLASKTVGYRGQVIYVPQRPGEIHRSCLNPAKAMTVLGWSPSVDLASGIAATLSWMKNSRTMQEDRHG